MDKKVTIYTLAKELGVSASAVSRAFTPGSRLSSDKRELILKAAQEYGFSPNRVAARLSRKPIRIGVVIVNRIPEFYQSMCEGIQSSANELAAEKVTVDIRLIRPDDEVVESFLEIIEYFYKEKYDGIILHGLYNLKIITRIDELHQNGIPVVTLHNDLPASKRLFNSTTNAELTGAMAAELLRLFIHKPQKNVIILTGNMSSSIHQQLFISFSTACLREGLNLLQHYDTMDVPAYAEAFIKEAFRIHPDIDGIYVSSANSIPVCEYLEAHDLSKKVKLVTSDVFMRLNTYIHKGVVSATIFQDPFSQGKNAFSNLYRYIADHETIPKVIFSTPKIIIHSNLNLYEREPNLGHEADL